MLTTADRSSKNRSLYSSPVGCVSVRSLCVFEHSLFFAQLERFGGLPLAKRMLFTATIARTTTRVRPRSKKTRVETLKGRKAMKGPFDDHVQYAIFNACHHGHNAQSHALRTGGPCIPIGNFPGLKMEALALQYEDLSKKERRRKVKRSQQHEHCLAGRRLLRPARRRRSSRFFPTLSFFLGVFPGDFCFKIERSASSWHGEHL